MRGEHIIGMMSGTSVDGMDAALVEFESANRLSLKETHFAKFDSPLKQKINQLALSQQELAPDDYAELHEKLAQLYAQTSLELIDKSGLQPHVITAIANHGQTVRHQPNVNPPFSLQLGDAQTIADITGIPTIGNFRQGDLAVGGQGAPLMPAFHHAVFSDSTVNRYLLNLGGIANITQLAADSDAVVGFDTGPGNTLMDQWIARHKSLNFDQNGEWAASGQALDSVLSTLLNDPYFQAGFPKSTGTDYFNLDWLESRIDGLDAHSPADIQATLLQLTVQSISLGLKQVQQSTNAEPPYELYICGGGAHNQLLLAQLQKSLPDTTVQTTAALGIEPDWVEAMGFAWLGYCRLHGLHSNLPSVTGARKPVVLGEVFTPALS